MIILKEREVGAAFDRDRTKTFVLRPIDFRVPVRGDLYLDRTGKLQRFRSGMGERASRRSKKCLIFEEVDFEGFVNPST